jgi:hypothetical protein
MEKLLIPRTLDLLVFSGGGPCEPLQRAVPVPVLRRELPPRGLPQSRNLTFLGTKKGNWPPRLRL